MQIAITVFIDGIKEIPGKLEFNEECELKQLITEVVISMETILKNHGIVGYRKQWNAQDFPLGSYLQMKYYLLNNSKFPLVINNPDEWNENLETNLLDELNLIKKSVF
ncbi:hypothetical protein GZH47_22195 [Paenibacillus rhizovicinus]|uniref:Uncharacterized protein n=1 Tax=Paenibacillus rhizovicinus TaxID=2704463 RepID=A0A6C0P415_9BACL|nr:hypothetical protein [Paenibacillus rhizovicinus]QHW33229.1 hypothetical protein GZH47_22195 [Paenibacillus rhizovicinus]